MTSSGKPLSGRNILVVEDEYLIALGISENVTEAGGVVVGPLSTVAAALETVESGQQIDAAVLDVNLRGQLIYPVADALVARKIPFVFTTGYDRASIPDRFSSVKRCEKPLSLPDLLSI